MTAGTYTWSGSTEPVGSAAPPPGEDTWEDRFKRALRVTRKQGVVVRQNVMECCRSCVSLEKLGLPDWESVPFVWTYGGQGSRYRWADGVPVASNNERYYSGQPIQRIYFNHGGPGVEGPTALVAALQAEGITVEWDGSEGKCPEVLTPAGEAVQAT